MHTVQKDDTLFLIPEKNMVASAIEKLRDHFVGQLKERLDYTHVVLDVKDVELVDSLGVNLIIGLYRQAISEAKTFEIINAGEKFEKVARFFKFRKIFNVTGEHDFLTANGNSEDV